MEKPLKVTVMPGKIPWSEWIAQPENSRALAEAFWAGIREMRGREA